MHYSGNTREATPRDIEYLRMLLSYCSPEDVDITPHSPKEVPDGGGRFEFSVWGGNRATGVMSAVLAPGIGGLEIKKAVIRLNNDGGPPALIDGEVAAYAVEYVWRCLFLAYLGLMQAPSFDGVKELWERIGLPELSE